MAPPSGSWPSSWSSKRSPASRIVVVFRGAPALAERLLPEGAKPLAVQGQAVLLLCFTHEPREHPWLADRLGSGCDHLSYLLAADLESGGTRRPGTFPIDRATSSWIEARWSERLGRRGSHRSTFDFRSHTFDVELRVARDGVEEVYLRGEPAPQSSSALFPQTRALEEFLAECSDLRADGFAPEPLLLHELRAGFLESGAQKDFELDSAFRFVSRRLVPARTTATTRLRAVIEPVPQAGMLPTP